MLRKLVKRIAALFPNVKAIPTIGEPLTPEQAARIYGGEWFEGTLKPFDIQQGNQPITQLIVREMGTPEEVAAEKEKRK